MACPTASAAACLPGQCLIRCPCGSRWGAAVDGRERKGAKAGGQKKVHLLAAVTHVPGLVIAQDKVAKHGKASEITVQAAQRA
jgi:hypothetical protein